MIIINFHHFIFPDHTESLFNLIIICWFASGQAWKKSHSMEACVILDFA